MPRSTAGSSVYARRAKRATTWSTSVRLFWLRSKITCDKSGQRPMDPDDEEEEDEEDSGEPDDPDNYTDEAEDKETTDNERDDHEGWPVVDWGEYACDFGDFIGE